METNDEAMFRELHGLVVREFESTITPAEHERLESLLLQSAAARRLYSEYMQETGSLRWLCLEEFEQRADAVTTGVAYAAQPVGRRSLRPSIAVATAIACSLLIVWFGFLGNRETRDREIAKDDSRAAAAKGAEDMEVAAGGVGTISAGGDSVATVTALESARWAEGGAGGRLLSRCRIGERRQLEAGRVELTFDSGVLVTLFGPADFDIVSPTSIRCRRGRVTALVDERGTGFTIETPQAKVVDLGTQFGLNVSDNGVTQVVVFQGSVDLSYGAGSTSDEGARVRLEQGEALWLDRSGKLERLMAVRRDQFLGGGGASNRPFVIADVRDNIRMSEKVKSYQIVHGGFGEDTPCFVDRDHEWNGMTGSGLPEFLVGADYIMPFNDDKFVRSLELIVRISRPATLYVFLDNNMEVPAWLKEDFEDTGVDIGLDGATTEWHPENALGVGPGESVDFPFSVWRREVDRAGDVRLGSVKPPPVRWRGFNMYGIAAVAREGRDRSR